MMGNNPFRTGLIDQLRAAGFRVTQFAEGDTWYIANSDDKLVGILFGDRATQRPEPNPWFADDQR
jgi:hypothetical protein